jgi:hypothetical protein
MKNIILLGVLLLSNVGWAAKAQWTKVQAHLDCSYYRNRSEVTIKRERSSIIYAEVTVASDDIGRARVNQCRAASEQAKMEGMGVYINFVTGEVVPEDGFFYRVRNSH